MKKIKLQRLKDIIYFEGLSISFPKSHKRFSVSDITFIDGAVLEELKIILSYKSATITDKIYHGKGKGSVSNKAITMLRSSIGYKQTLRFKDSLLILHFNTKMEMLGYTIVISKSRQNSQNSITLHDLEASTRDIEHSEHQVRTGKRCGDCYSIEVENHSGKWVCLECLLREERLKK